MVFDRSRSVGALKVVAVAWTAAFLGACTAMPTIVNFNHDQQKKLSSVVHWRIIAGEVLADVSDEVAIDRPRCIHIDPPDPKTMSQFQTFLTAAVTEELLNPGSTRHRPESTTEKLQDQERADKTKTVEQITTEANAKDAATKNATAELKAAAANRPDRLYIHAKSPEANINCNVISLTTAVIEHKGPVARSYPFKYTALASGLVGIRHVVRAFSEARFVGTVAAAEAAFWLASGFEASDTVTELTITTSYTDAQGFYLAEATNVYYIDSEDSALYEAPKHEEAAVTSEQVAQSDGNPFTPRLAFDGSAWQEEEEDRDEMADRWRRWHDSPPHRRLVVRPETISACDPNVELAVSGIYLSHQPQAYMLGTLVASQFGEAYPHDFNGPQTAQLQFAGSNMANIGLTDLTLSMVGRDGIMGTAHIGVEGDPKSCATLKQTSNTTVAAVTATSSNVEITPAAIGSSKAEVCQGPWGLIITGAGAADVKSAQITQGKHVGTRSTTKGVKTVTFTFDPLTEYRGKTLPAGDKVEVQFKNSKGTAFKEDVSATCTPPAAAVDKTKSTPTDPPKGATTNTPQQGTDQHPPIK